MRTNLRVRVFGVTRTRTVTTFLLVFVCAALYANNAHAQATNDFRVQRGVTNITGTSTVLEAGVAYTAPSASTSAFIRITNAHYTGGGPSSGTAGDMNADAATVYIKNPENITSSIELVRGTTTGDTRVAWEIVEYQGAVGADNEMVVRDQGTVTYGVADLHATTSVISGVIDDRDVVPFITAQFNPDAGTNDYNTVLSTSQWNANSDTATFTRGESGSDAVIVSYAIVEFNGSNWHATRTPDHTYSATGTTETEAITPVGSVSRALVHAQHRAGSALDTHADFGHEAWLSGIGQVSFRLNGSAQDPGGHVSAAWVIENMQTKGDVMEVTRSNGSISAGGGGLTTVHVPIGKTLDDVSAASIFVSASNDGTGISFPEPLMTARLLQSSTTEYELAVSDDSDPNLYRTAVVEWPTAERDITQNYYQFYLNNDSITPSDPWPCESGSCGENTPITGVDNPVQVTDTIRIRMTLQLSASNMPANTTAFRLQYGEKQTSCTAISGSDWHDIGDIGSTTALWRGTSTSATDGATLPSTLLSVSDVAGTFEEENPSALNPNAVAVGDDIEYDWVLENNGAPQKTDYCFRMIESEGTELFGYDFYPTLQTAGFGVESETWRWYDDAENETPSTALAATNTAPTDVPFDDTIQLRLLLDEVNGADETGAKFRLQFSQSSDFASTSDVAEIAACEDGKSLWCYADGGGIDNATITTALLADADSCSGGTGPGCGSHNESGTSSTTSEHVHEATASSEYAFTIRHAGARVNTVYYFRVFDEANGEVVPLAGGASYPSVVTEGASLAFTMSSVGSGTVTEGITTDVETSATEISFGTVPINTEYEAAHRLIVDTNGTEGYKVLMYSTGNLTDALGQTIESVAGTNESPTSWATGCPPSQDSCFGYHSGDDLLEGGSTRFFADDTYAAVSTTTPEEVLFSSSPVAGETTDVIYKMEVREVQGPGEYQTGVIYIATPVF